MPYKGGEEARRDFREDGEDVGKVDVAVTEEYMDLRRGKCTLDLEVEVRVSDFGRARVSDGMGFKYSAVVAIETREVK